MKNFITPLFLALFLLLAVSVRASAQEGKVPYLTAMVCQNYEPGDDSLAGVGFQKANIGLVPDGDGFLLHIMPG